MGPRCSSAETQVCHRSYIIAARYNPYQKGMSATCFGQMKYTTLCNTAFASVQHVGRNATIQANASNSLGDLGEEVAL